VRPQEEPNFNIVTCMSDYRRGFELEIRFIGHFSTRLVTALNYSAIADLHTLQITTAHAKSSTYVCYVFNTRSLVKASNSGDSSASTLSCTKSSLHRLPYNLLISKLVPLITPWHGPRRNHRL
jgi:hypothetical protein